MNRDEQPDETPSGRDGTDSEPDGAKGAGSPDNQGAGAKRTGAQVELYTDGACRGNPGPGGWACILRHLRTGAEKELSGGEPHTTNNRMELMAVIRGLESLTRPCRVELFTDSVYVGKGLSEWLPSWKRNNWRRGRKKDQPVVNADLWQRADELLQRHQLKYTRVAGHSGHPENERCDELATQAADRQR